uniref:Putative RING finger protein n=1 Tax=Perkinsus marinus TaxID=31276 RepID=A7YXQ2_9ALVE|nr:putative RING finger protein [Perkinsus marinus]
MTSKFLLAVCMVVLLTTGASIAVLFLGPASYWLLVALGLCGVCLLVLVLMIILVSNRKNTKKATVCYKNIYGRCPFPPTATSSVDICPICLDDFHSGQLVAVLLSCKHLFHDNCMDSWLHASGSGFECSQSSCPVCRVEFPH